MLWNPSGETTWHLAFSYLWHRVVWKRFNDVSRKKAASLFRVESGERSTVHTGNIRWDYTTHEMWLEKQKTLMSPHGLQLKRQSWNKGTKRGWWSGKCHWSVSADKRSHRRTYCKDVRHEYQPNGELITATSELYPANIVHWRHYFTLKSDHRTIQGVPGGMYNTSGACSLC
jgi:hypothetical protein